MIKSKQLARALYDLSHEKKENLEEKFFDFIKKRKLEGQLPSILYHLEKIEETEQEKKEVVIETAHKIDHELAMKIKKHLGAEHHAEILKIKKELVAGFRAKWQGKIYDSSIATGLKKLEEVITN